MSDEEFLGGEENEVVMDEMYIGHRPQCMLVSAMTDNGTRLDIGRDEQQHYKTFDEQCNKAQRTRLQRKVEEDKQSSRCSALSDNCLSSFATTIV